MEQRRIDTFDPLAMLMSINSDDTTWKEQVSAGIIYLMSVVDELREENLHLRRQLEAPKNMQSDSDEKLTFNAAHVKAHPIKGFDPLQPDRFKAIGSIVADFANGHGLNGSTLAQVVQPITTGVIRKLFDEDAAKYTYTEDSIGKGRPARYAKVPTEFIKELSEAICDGFNPTRVQRAQILPQARTMAGTVARNYFNNARSHRKKIRSQSITPPIATSVDSDINMTPITPIPIMPTSLNSHLFETRGFRPVFLPIVSTISSSATYFNNVGEMETENR